MENRLVEKTVANGYYVQYAGSTVWYFAALIEVSTFRSHPLSPLNKIKKDNVLETY